MSRPQKLSLDAVVALIQNQTQVISGIDYIDKDANFFRAGLSSIMITRLKQFVDNEFRVDVPMRLFYDRTDTPARLAAHILENGEVRIDLPTPISQKQGDILPLASVEPSIPILGVRTQDLDMDLLFVFEQQLNLMEQQLDLLMQQPHQIKHQMDQTGDLSEDRHKTFGLSSAQKRIYFLNQLEQGEAAYHILAAAIIEGPLDVEGFLKAFEVLIERHESLHTGFYLKNDKLVQTVFPVNDIEISESIRVIEVDERNIDETISNFTQPFDLQKPPLIRIGLGKLDASRHLLIIDAHHIVIDGYSYNILMPEWIGLYRNETLSPVPTPYSKYAIWEQEQVNSGLIQHQEQFWLDRFKDNLSVLDLPLDFARSDQQRFSGSVVKCRLEKEKMQRLKDLAGQTRSTLFMVMLSAFGIFLSKLTGQNDIVVGTPIDSRSKGDFVNTVGMFSNTLVLRSYPQKHKSFTSYLDEVKQDVLQAFDHQDYPFDMFVEKLGIERNLSRNPLFDVMFVYENEDERIIQSRDLVFSAYDIDLKTTNFDFILEIMESSQGRDQGMDVRLIYSTALFTKQTMSRWQTSFLTLIDQIISYPNIRINEIDLLDANQKQTLLKAFNPEFDKHENPETILDRFDRQVEKTPDLTAIVYQGQSLSFADLDCQSQEFAHYLNAKFNINHTDVVGVLVNPGPDMMKALLGLVKLGAVFVPIEPDTPVERVDFVLKDSHAKLLITETGCVDVENLSIPSIMLDKPRENIETGTDLKRPLAIDIFYIIYTSGTTGKPKGTMVTHGSLVNYLSWFEKAFDITSKDRFVLVSSFAFDMAHTSLWITMLSGATLYLVSVEDRKDPHQIAQYITNEKITCLKVTPSYFYTLVTSPTARQKKAFSDLRLVILGGEDIRHSDLKAYFKINPKTVCVNEYGPTEATIACIAYPIHKNNLNTVLNRQMIGKPIDNTLIYILNPDGQLCPIGVRGEICISGTGVAKGYINQEELTRQKFLPDPFFPGNRIYRTGDYGRFLADGNIEFFGRIDSQVKIKGYRVELGEIETALLSHPAICDVLVLADRFDSAVKEIVAYVVCNENEEKKSEENIDAGQLRSYLAAQLPSYMLPSYFIKLDKIPLTPNGKVDRKALVHPHKSGAALVGGTIYAAPRTEIEKMLTQIWETILARKEIGVDDNYFDLGGDSIKAVLIVSRILEAGYGITVREIFQAPTISKLAKCLQAGTAEFSQKPISGQVALNPIQARFFELNPRQAGAYGLGITLTSSHRLDQNILAQVLKGLQDHHDALRLTFQTQPDQIVAQINPSGQSAVLESIDLKDYENPYKTFDRHIQRTAAAIDIEHGPIMRAILGQFKDHDCLAIIIHHLAIDGVSWRILIQDLVNGYQNLLHQPNPGFSMKTDSIQQWSEALRKYGQSQALLDQIPFWQSMTALDDIKRPFFHRTATGVYQDARKVSGALTPDQSRILIQESGKRYRAGIDQILLTALLRAFKACFSHQSVYLELEGHGREVPKDEAFKHPDQNRYIDITHTVGWFTTMYPVVLTVSGTGKFMDDLHAIQNTLKQIPDNGIGFGVLRYMPLQDKSSNALPLANSLPSIGFNYLGRFDDLSLGEVFEHVEEIEDHLIGPRLNQWHDLEVELIHMQKTLFISLTYNKTVHAKGAIKRLLDAFQNELVQICQAESGDSEYNPAIPITYGHLSQTELQQLAQSCQVSMDRIEDVYPLSPLQQGMLYHALIEENDHAFFEQFTFDMQGDLDLSLFEKSWNHVFDTYDVFRANIVHKGADDPLQVILKERFPEFVITDLSQLTKTKQQKTIADFKKADKQRGFDLAKDVLMRVNVFILGQNRYQIIWSHHHIIIDGWSCGIMVQRLLQTYQNLVQNLDPHAGLTPAVPYLQYIQWLETQDQKAAANYWADYLTDYTKLAKLPGIKRSASSKNGFERKTLAFTLPLEQTRHLSQICSQNHTTLNTAVLCAWGVLLSHYNHTDDVVFGSVVSGRPADLSGVADIVGLFLNTVPVRIKVDRDKSLARTLEKIRQSALESEPYHYYSLADIQAQTQLGKDLLDSVIIFENYPLSLALQKVDQHFSLGFSVRAVEEFEQTNYNLALEVYPDECLSMTLIYNGTVYTRDHMEQFQRDLIQILTAMATSVDQPMESIRNQLISQSDIQEKEQFLAATQDISEDF